MMRNQTLKSLAHPVVNLEVHHRLQHQTKRTSDNKVLHPFDRFSTLHCSTGGSARSLKSKARMRMETKMITVLHRVPRVAIMTWKHSRKRSCGKRFGKYLLIMLNLMLIIQFHEQLKRGKIEPNGTSSALTNSVPVRREFVMYNKGE